MTHLTFSVCLLLLMSLLVLDVWVSYILRRGARIRATQKVLALWPLQVVAHVAIFYFIATTPLTTSQSWTSESFLSGPYADPYLYDEEFDQEKLDQSLPPPPADVSQEADVWQQYI